MLEIRQEGTENLAFYAHIQYMSYGDAMDLGLVSTDWDTSRVSLYSVTTIVRLYDPATVQKAIDDQVELLKKAKGVPLSSLLMKKSPEAMGVSVCSVKDQFSRKIGRQVALGRALKSIGKKVIYKTTKKKVEVPSKSTEETETPDGTTSVVTITKIYCSNRKRS